MSKTPRNVRLALALLLACAPCARGARAQKRPPSPQSKAEREKERSRRRGVAVLLEVAGEAKALEDASQRATVLTLAASALWGADEQAARATFARAWDAAVQADEAEFKKEQEEGRYGDLPERFTGMREEVLAAAAQHDPRMADAWLGALADWLSRRRNAEVEEAANAEGGADLGPLNEFTRDGQRLSLASTLVDGGSYAEAARVATPALQGGVSGALVEFLLRLRVGAPEEADRLYLQLLASARARRDAGANDVLILSSYVLTPRLLMAVNADGSVGLRPIGNPPPEGAFADAAPSARVREVFFDSAAAILLHAPVDAQAAGDMSALYFAIARLLPYFEREGSEAHAAALQAKLMSIAPQLGFERRGALESKLETRDLSPQNPTDPLRRLLDAAESTGDTKLRDEARVKVVVEAAGKRLWERARRVAEEIVDPERQREARAAIDSFKVATARTAFDGEDDFEKAAALARDADVVPALRAYGFVLAADLAARHGLRERSAALLEEAFAQAAQTEGRTFARDAALMMTAATAARLESPRAWDALSAAVASLNEDEKFDGGDIRFKHETRVSLGPGVAEALDYALAQFDLEELFEAAAQKNFDRAAAAARNLKSPAARAQALIWAARTELVKAGRAFGYVRPSR